VARDQLATAVVLLEYLDQVGLGPRADHSDVADALDDVAVACSPHRDLAVNPAKMLAIALADTTPSCGVSSLAARAARRVAGRSAARRDSRSPATPSTPTADRGRAAALRSTTPSPTVRETRGRCCSSSTTARSTTSCARTAEGGSALERLASLVAVPDFTSIYLAMAHGLDPMAVPAVSEMKELSQP
jgi:hypothetical protein